MENELLYFVSKRRGKPTVPKTFLCRKFGQILLILFQILEFHIIRAQKIDITKIVLVNKIYFYATLRSTFVQKSPTNVGQNVSKKVQ